MKIPRWLPPKNLTPTLPCWLGFLHEDKPRWFACWYGRVIIRRISTVLLREKEVIFCVKDWVNGQQCVHMDDNLTKGYLKMQKNSFENIKLGELISMCVLWVTSKYLKQFSSPAVLPTANAVGEGGSSGPKHRRPSEVGGTCTDW